MTAFQAERDGERVRGVIKSMGGDQWEVAEIEEPTSDIGRARVASASDRLG